MEADSHRPGAFLSEDIAFLQAAANLLGVAIERCRREAELERSLQVRELLIREADHRIKNSLQLVVSLLSLQRSKLPDAQATAALDSAIGRVRAVAEAHRALHQSKDLTTIAFDQMLRDLCHHTGELSPATAITCNADENIEIDAERAIPLGLIVSELLTNAARHAYPEGTAGTIEAGARRTPDHLEVTVTDRGVGLRYRHGGIPDTRHQHRASARAADRAGRSDDFAARPGHLGHPPAALARRRLKATFHPEAVCRPWVQAKMSAGCRRAGWRRVRRRCRSASAAAPCRLRFSRNEPSARATSPVRCSAPSGSSRA